MTAIPMDVKTLERFGVYAILLVFMAFGYVVYKNDREDDALVAARITALKEVLVANDLKAEARIKKFDEGMEKLASVNMYIESRKEKDIDYVHSDEEYIVVRIPTKETIRFIKNLDKETINIEGNENAQTNP